MIRYEPWSLRGYDGPVFQVYVNIENSRSIKELRQVKDELNNYKGVGVLLIDNKSPAIKRLGWEMWDDGTYYRKFD